MLNHGYLYTFLPLLFDIHFILFQPKQTYQFLKITGCKTTRMKKYPMAVQVSFKVVCTKVQCSCFNAIKVITRNVNASIVRHREFVLLLGEHKLQVLNVLHISNNFQGGMIDKV